jgi:Protein of unknown function (DUF1573)
MIKQAIWACALGAVVGLVGFLTIGSGTPRLPTIDVPAAIDLGLQDRGRLVETSFLVTNRGSQPLVLNNFRTGCGCMKLSRDAASGPMALSEEVVPSTSSLRINVGLVLTADNGRFQKQIQFDTNDSKHPSVAITLLGETDIGVYTVPSQLHIGSVKPGERSTGEALVVDARRGRRSGALDIRCASRELRVDSFALSVHPAHRVGLAPEDQVYVLRLSLTAPKTICNFQHTVTIVDASGSEFASLPIGGAVDGPFSLHPTQIVLSGAGPSDAPGRPYRCICRSHRGPLLLSVARCPKGLDVHVSTNPKAAAQFVEIQRARGGPAYSGAQSIILSAIAENGPSETLELPVSIVALDVK